MASYWRVWKISGYNLLFPCLTLYNSWYPYVSTWLGPLIVFQYIPCFFFPDVALWEASANGYVGWWPILMILFQVTSWATVASWSWGGTNGWSLTGGEGGTQRLIAGASLSTSTFLVGGGEAVALHSSANEGQSWGGPLHVAYELHDIWGLFLKTSSWSQVIKFFSEKVVSSPSLMKKLGNANWLSSRVSWQILRNQMYYLNEYGNFCTI